MTDRPRNEARSDIHALSGAYAVDALDPEERTRFETHLTHCPDCRTEVASLRETAAVLADDAAADPPPALRARILAEIDTVRPLPPLVAGESEEYAGGASPSARRWRFGRSSSSLLVAAALALFVAVGVTWWQPWSDTGERVPTAAERVLAADDAARETQRLPDGAEATLVVSRTQGRAVLLTEEMPPAPQGSVYELWLQTPAGDMEPAGLMPDEPDAVVLLDGDATDATAVGITIEPDGGSEQPTSEPIALFDLADS